MKQVHPSYTFNASTKTITLTGLNIDQDQLLLIVNATRGVQYFNFADSSLRGAVTSGANTSVVLTDASTTGHANGDALVIYYDDQAASQAVSGTVTANPGTGAFTVSGTVGLDAASLVALENITVTVGSSVALAAGSAQVGSVTISGFTPSTLPPSTVTVGNTVTISGTVTANAVLDFTDGGDSIASDNGGLEPSLGVQLGYWDSAIGEYRLVRPSAGLPVSGTVTANIFGNDSINGGQIAVKLDDEGAVFVKPSSAFEIQKLPSGALTTRFGSVVTANSAFITSAVTNTSRKYLLAQNISAGTVTIGIGFSPTTTQGIQLTAGGGLTFDAFCPTGAVYWLGAVTGAAFTILEG